MQASYSIAQLTALALTPPKMIELAARTGYDQAGVRLLPVAPGAVAYSLMDDKPMLRETLARIDDTGVKVFDLELIRLDGQFDVQRYLPFLEVGAQLGAKAVLVAGDDPEPNRLIEHYARLCDAMQPFGLSADLEFMPWTAVRDLASALHIVEQADRANGGILVDALHFDRSDSRFEDLQRIPAQWLNYAQICDGPALRPNTRDGLIQAARGERLLPGEGDIDLARIWRSLPATVPVSVEIPHDRRVAQVGVEAWARQALAAAKAIIEPL
ncbi:sugar phosphate isomerase/epimerase family protein [Pseudomonas plecoglossicida]|uniref:sugar phosphate isomerase/epimerase family protein n=1 Tax=Pseudomonas plecoglossicida TaxID=70775 RepID=UPI0015E40D77|nr:TIM barrel protein [Pseudomonas plecoglossicida]MBA1321356.1 TIM barrel protein [Pseudomonas plecoglossicida]